MKSQPSLFMKPSSKEEQLLDAFYKFQEAERNNREGYITVAETLNLIGQEAYIELLKQKKLKVKDGLVTTFKQRRTSSNFQTERTQVILRWKYQKFGLAYVVRNRLCHNAENHP